VSFYTPYFISEQTLGEVMDEMTSGRAVPDKNG
jgi:hypothetical protein